MFTSMIQLMFTVPLLVSTPETTSVFVGEKAHSFSLIDVHGKTVSLDDFKGKIIVLEWTNPGCPFVKAHYVKNNIPALQRKYTERGVVWLTVNSTNPTHKDARSAEELNQVFSEWNSAATAHLIDNDGTVGRLYDAKTTPHLFIIDQTGTLVYNGAIDDDRSTNGGENAKINYVASALDELADKGTVTSALTKPYGCSVKY
jgi:peroxiredoxin